MGDARPGGGRGAPLNLGAVDADDLRVISSLAQDAVLPAAEMAWDRKARRFGLLLNRFRWEDRGLGRRAPERVRSVLAFDSVLRVASRGVDRSGGDSVLSLLSVTFDAGEDGGGDIVLTLAGDGAIRLSVEAVEAVLKDVTRPYAAPSRSAPRHRD